MSRAAATIEQLVLTTGELYSLPAVAIEVMKLTSDPQVDARRLRECIERDPALTTKILRVVNSSLFGLSQHVADLNQALTLLGMKPLKLLVLGFSLPEALFAPLGGDVLKRYWQRTLVKAIAAREIAARLRGGYDDEAFIAGLLQDIGFLVLVRYVGRAYLDFVSKVQARGADLNQLQRRALGFDHTEISARLLEHWHLPASIVEAVDQTAKRQAGRGTSLAQAIELAELVTSLLCDGRTIVLPAIEREMSRQQPAKTSWLDELIATLQPKMRQLAESLSVEVPADLDYRSVLEQARRQMIDAAEDLIGDLVRQHGTSRHASGVGDAELEPQLLAETQALAAAFASVRRPRTIPALRPDIPARTAVADFDEPRPQTADSIQYDALVREQLQLAASDCRRRRLPLSLLLVEVDRHREIAGNDNQFVARHVFDHVLFHSRWLDHPGAFCIRTHEAGLAIVLPDCDRSQAARLGNELVLAARAARVVPPDNRSASISVGAATVALPPRNFPAEDLLRRAQGCLDGARSSGGNVLKSIEIC
jgi:HD-like signal output (HDOD) protein/GGDEF domain-containing protein